MSKLLDVFDWERFNERMGTYRPVLDRFIVALSLLGVALVVHLGLQQARGFEDGCFGVGALAPGGGGFDCAAVVASAASSFLGVSNIVWGVLFYTGVVALSFAALARPAWRLRAKQIRAGFLGMGLLYSAYLVYYQTVELDAYCALCLVSAGLVALLGVLQVVSLVPTNRSSSTAMSSRSLKREFTLLTYLIALTGLVVAIDVVFATHHTAEAASAGTAAVVRAPDTTEVAEGCFYDAEKNPVADFGGLVDFQDPVEGNAQAPVTIVEYFDPNCPHCKTMHAVMKEAVAAYGDDAQFVYKPMPLWEYSIVQIEALYAAAQEGKFMEMLEAQYARQQRGGLSLEQLQAIAREIGMNPDVLTTRLEQQIHRDRVLQQRRKAIEIGVNSTPTLIVNGRFIDGRSRTLECIDAFIEAAAQDASAETSG